jgi:hypothetical protein
MLSWGGMRVAGLLVALAAVRAPQAAGTEPAASVRLTWHAPPACPKRTHLEQRIAQHLGRDLDQSVEKPALEISGIVSAPPEHADPWLLELVITRGDTTGSRKLEADTCAELVDAAAFISAVAIDPTVATSEPEPEPRPEPKPQPEPEPQPQPKPEPTRAEQPTAPQASGPRGALALSGGVGFGALPRIFPAVDLRGALLVKRARIELGLQHGFATQTPIIDDVGGRFWVLVATVGGCFVPRVKRVEFPVCGGGRIGALRGVGIGDRVSPQAQSSVWGGADLQAGLNWVPRGFIALFVRGQLGVSPANFAFRVDGAGEVFRPTAGYGTALAGVEGRFGGKTRP